MVGRDYGHPERQKRGGERFTAFFFVAVTVVIGACVAAGNELRNHDTLLRFVPSDAIAYVHANGARAATRLLEVSGAPADASRVPAEAAVYAVERDGALAWSVLTPDTITHEPATTLADDRPANRSLATMRSATSLQAYVKPDAFLDPIIDGTEIGPLVFGASVREHSFTITVMPVDLADERGSLGLRIAPSNDNAARPLFADGADGLFYGTNADVSAFNVLFPEREHRNAFEQGVLEAEAEIRTLFSRTAVAVSMDEAQPTIHLPAVAPEALAAAIERYATSAWPVRRLIVLPDSVRSYELLIDPENSRFSPSENGFSMLETGDGRKIAIGSDGRSGTVVLIDPKSPPTLDAFAPANPGACPSTTGSFVTFKDGGRLTAILPYGDKISSYLDLKSLKIEEIGDNVVFFCGYDVDIVDK